MFQLHEAEANRIKKKMIAKMREKVLNDAMKDENSWMHDNISIYIHTLTSVTFKSCKWDRHKDRHKETQPDRNSVYRIGVL